MSDPFLARAERGEDEDFERWAELPTTQDLFIELWQDGEIPYKSPGVMPAFDEWIKEQGQSWHEFENWIKAGEEEAALSLMESKQESARDAWESKWR